MSPRWGLGYWKMSPGYKHTAPLGLNAQVFYVATPGAHSAPLEHIARTCRHAIDISLRWSENTHVAPLGLTGIMLGFTPSIYRLVLLKSVAAIAVGGDSLDRSTQPTYCQMSIHHSNFHYYALRGEENR